MRLSDLQLCESLAREAQSAAGQMNRELAGRGSNASLALMSYRLPPETHKAHHLLPHQAPAKLWPCWPPQPLLYGSPQGPFQLWDMVGNCSNAVLRTPSMVKETGQAGLGVPCAGLEEWQLCGERGAHTSRQAARAPWDQGTARGFELVKGSFHRPAPRKETEAFSQPWPQI